MALKTYDPDADKQHEPKVETQPGTTDMSEFEREFEKNPPITGNNLRGREDKPSKKSGDSAKDLKDQEDSAPDRLGYSGGDHIWEKLGKGYTGEGSKQSKGLSKLYGSNSKLKKKVAIAGAAAGGGFVLSALIFIMLLPLKIEGLMNNLENHYSAATSSAIDTQVEGMYASWMKEKVLPNLNKKGCHSTIDASCTVFSSTSTNPIGKLYNSWKQSKLEQKLATKYGLVFAKDSSGRLFLNKDGAHIDLGTHDNIFGDANTKAVSRNELRTAVRDSLQQETLYKRLYTRFKVGKLLESKYGLKRCVIACKIRDTFADAKDQKIKAAQGYLIQRVLSPVSESTSLILQCVIGGATAENCGTTPDGNSNVGEGGDQERTSSFQRDLQSQFDSLAQRYGTEKLDQIISDSKDIADNGLTRHVVSKLGEKIGIGVASDKALDAVPIVGQINLVASVVGGLDNIGPKLHALTYAATAAGAVQLYMTYRSVADEAKSGHMDATELGSFVTQLGNTAKDANGNTSDSTQTPLYSNLMGGSSTGSATMFGSLFGGSAFADSNSSKSSYRCNDGGAVPTGKLVCDEEQMNGGSAVGDAITNLTNNIPFWGTLTSVASIWNSGPGAIIKAASNALGSLISYVPGVSALMGSIGNFLQPFIAGLTRYLIPTPFSDKMSGGRTADMIAGGVDVAQNKSAQVQLGGAHLSKQAMADIQNRQLADLKQAFDSKSMFARMFDTTDSYSMVSQLATNMPTSLVSAANSSISSIIANPFGKISAGLSSIFSGNHAFAATPAQDDAFGVAQYGYTPEQLAQVDDAATAAGGYENYWTQNCADPANPDQINPTVMNQWLDAQQGDPNTGEAVSDTPQPCLLVQTAYQVAGGLSDPTLLPQGSTNNQPIDATAQSNTVNGGLPLSTTTGNANQVITVVADSVTGKKASLQAWDKSGNKWVEHGTAITANVGSQGLTGNPQESLSATPIGSFPLTQAFGVKANPGTDLKYTQTNPKDWWDENPKSPTYNQLVVQTNSPGGNSEQLVKIIPQYDYAVVIDANMNPVTPGAGSGFFLHVSDGGPTAGCVSIPENDLVSIMKWLKTGNNPRILIGTAQ